MRITEIIVERRSNPELNVKLPISQQILQLVQKNGGTVDDYWIHCSPVEHVGFFGAQQTDSGQTIAPMKASPVPMEPFQGQTFKYAGAERGYQGPPQAKKKSGVWLSPLKPFLKSIDLGVVPWRNKFVFLVKLNDDAWVQPINTMQRIKTNLIGITPPEGKRKVGQFNPSSKIAVLFEPAFKVVGKWTIEEIDNQANRNNLSPAQLKNIGVQQSAQAAQKRAQQNKELDDLFN